MCMLVCQNSGYHVSPCSPCAASIVTTHRILSLCAQLRVYYSEVLTGVQSPTQYCTRSYFKVLTAAYRCTSTCAGHPHADWLAYRSVACEKLHAQSEVWLYAKCARLTGDGGRFELTTVKALHDVYDDRGR